MLGENIDIKKYIVDVPYPEPKVQRPNIQYANILLKDYAGAVSELTATNLYVFQHMVSDKEYDDYAELVIGVAIAEMNHLELLGQTIKLLGVKPIYIDNARPPGRLWTPRYVNFTTSIKEMLQEDIRSEGKAIENYKYHITLIEDIHIKELLERIISDEELHLRLFTKMYEKYSNKS